MNPTCQVLKGIDKARRQGVSPPPAVSGRVPGWLQDFLGVSGEPKDGKGGALPVGGCATAPSSATATPKNIHIIAASSMTTSVVASSETVASSTHRAEVAYRPEDPPAVNKGVVPTPLLTGGAGATPASSNAEFPPKLPPWTSRKD